MLSTVIMRYISAPELLHGGPVSTNLLLDQLAKRVVQVIDLEGGHDALIYGLSQGGCVIMQDLNMYLG